MDPSRQPNADVRMRGFAHRSTVSAALDWVDKHSSPLSSELIPVDQAVGRVLAESVTSEVNVPPFVRAMMDGYAIRAADVSGADNYNRLSLRIVGEILPGRDPAQQVGAGQACRIMTGAVLPEGADTVIPVEHTESTDNADIVHALTSLPPGKNVGRIGEDIALGATVLAPGRVLRPQDIGVLASVGCGSVSVVRRPRVRIVVTGNELLPLGKKPQRFQIVDANGPMLTTLVQRDMGISDYPGIVPDDESTLLSALRSEADVVLVSGGSSVGKEDYAPGLIRQHGELPIHGIAMRPSSPAGMGTMSGRLVFLLPGNPVSCLCAYDFFAGRAIRILAGLSAVWPYPSSQATLSRKLVSTVGRTDYARVRVADGIAEPIAISGASMLSSTTRADGFVVIPADSEGYAEGTNVQVYLYDRR